MRCFKVVFAIILMTIISCSGTESISQYSKEVKLKEACEFEQRRNDGKVRNLLVKIESDGVNFLLTTEEYKYSPCNLNWDGLKVGDSLLISGSKKLMKPNEFWSGHPIKLVSAYQKE
ncbi:hypothetical protein [Roseivirga pacifica]|nr:hypothetical protein [Roseivirga pacifica]